MRAVSPPRVLVTGGSGFIGQHVVHALLDDGADITVADRRAFPGDVSGGDGVGGGRVRMVIGDLCDPSVVAEAVRPGTDVIIHLAALTRAARDGTGVQVYGDWTQVRDLVHVDDVVAGLFAAWRGGFSGPLILGAGESVSVNDIVDAARGVTGSAIPVEHVPPKPGEMPAVIVDISAARALGYAPAHDLKSGLSTVWPEFSEAAK
jgi:nucleoside-diphosphate-sugar epimerase